MPINGPTTGSANALKDTDFEADAFAHGPLLQPVVKVDTDAGLDGTGSTANPLVVTLSADVGNDMSFGSDGGLFVDTAAGAFSFIISDGTNTQTINNGNTLLFSDSGIVTATVSATDTLTIDVAAPTLSTSTPYFTGV